MPNHDLRQPHVNERAPDFTLPATTGSLVTLSSLRKPAALVFMRHLA